jgi:hypothetical protein
MTGWYGMLMGREGVVDLAEESARNGYTNQQDS